MELVRAAREQPELPVPFGSTDAAESYLSRSTANMDYAKAVFSARQETLKTRARNAKRKKPILPARDIWRFLFTPAVLDTLINYTTYR